MFFVLIWGKLKRVDPYLVHLYVWVGDDDNDDYVNVVLIIKSISVPSLNQHFQLTLWRSSVAM